MRNVYEFKNVGGNVFCITECTEPNGPGVNCFFVIGTEKALLFDAGFGVVDTLRTELEKLTGLPIVCVVGHGHPDHAGAAELFDEVYMNHRDEPLLPISLSYERRMDDVFGSRGPGGPRKVDEELKAYAEQHIVDPGGKNFVYKDMDQGDVFDIGGDKLEVFALPGHTQGSVALLNREKNYAFISDCIGPRTALVTLPPEKRVGLIAYRDGLARFLENINEETVFWYGHKREPQEHCYLKDSITALNEILDGKTENDVRSESHFAKRQAAAGKCMTEHVSGTVRIVYDANAL